MITFSHLKESKITKYRTRLVELGHSVTDDESDDD